MRIVLTGGGTGGHIFPNIAVFEALKKVSGAEESSSNARRQTSSVLYIGEKGGMEEHICRRYGVRFSGIYAGKWRRYFSLRNVIDVLKFPVGFFQAFFLLMRFQPDVIFSKGGYVSLPVVFAGWILRRKIIIHESDAIPGLTTRISSRFADKICVAWKEAMRFFPASRVILTGIPLRKSVLEADASKGLRLTGFTRDFPIVMVVGGSLGAASLNQLVWKSLPRLLPHCQIVHFTGNGKASHSDRGSLSSRYKPFESLDKEYADVLACADIVVSRAGANAVFEFMALKKPMILIPLGRKASRGDQIANAEILEREVGALVLNEDDSLVKNFSKNILDFIRDTKKHNDMRKNMSTFPLGLSISDIILGKS